MEYRRKKCFSQKFFIILALLFVPLFIILNTNSAFALSSDYWSFKLRLRHSNDSEYSLSEPLAYSDMLTDVQFVNGIRAEVVDIGSVPSGTSFVTVSGKFNLVAQCYADHLNSTLEHSAKCPRINGDPPYLYASAINGVPTSFTSNSVNVYKTDWTIYDSQYNSYLHLRTFTFEYSYIISDNIPSSITTLAFFINIPGAMMGTSPNSHFIYYFEQDSRNLMSVDYTKTQTEALLQQQIQMQQNIYNQDNNYYNNEYEADSNISNQSSSDISDATNSQTTTIIGTIQSFVNSIGTIQTGTCTMTLPFPSFIGGDQTVNPCSGKDKAPTLITIGSSMFLIGIFVPFAFIVLKMIYGEIRSWTNG